MVILLNLGDHLLDRLAAGGHSLQTFQLPLLVFQPVSIKMVSRHPNLIYQYREHASHQQYQQRQCRQTMSPPHGRDDHQDSRAIRALITNRSRPVLGSVVTGDTKLAPPNSPDDSTIPTSAEALAD